MKSILKKAFTLIELVVVIAVIAILSAVSVVTYLAITKNAKESVALQEARMAWTEVAAEYLGGYNEFINQTDEYNGWYYDYKNNIAKYDYNDDYTVTYDGEKYNIVKHDSSLDKKWDSIVKSTVNFSNISLNGTPYGLKLSYYSDIYSRGFSWATNPSTTDSKLYVTKSNKGANADFSNAELINGEYDSSRAATTTHKAYIENLEPSTTYSYKVGSSSGWKYGVFRTEAEKPTRITAIELTDAQTKDPTLLYKWENTFAQAIETVGRNLDMVLYSGDQYDTNMPGSIDRSIRYSAALETINSYLDSKPYMAISGNHEPSKELNIYSNNNCINFAGETTSGKYYSFNYGNAHFINLNTNEIVSKNKFVDIESNSKTFKVQESFQQQGQWLINDLEDAKKAGYKWIIVNTHQAPYATGDHSNNSDIQNTILSLTPIFSYYHVDLVLQGHDHTYNKTLPYKWDSTGYTTSYNDSAVVNYNCETTKYNNEDYDLNPQGTYYVTTGASGHRVGSEEANSGIWADVNDTNGQGVNPSMTFTNNTYKICVGKITQSNSYKPFTYNSYTIDQIYNKGDYATGNVNAQMFGILNIKNNQLTYDFYTVNDNTVKLFDTLNIMKTI